MLRRQSDQGGFIVGNRRRVEREVSRFLTAAGLKHRAFTVNEVVEGLKRAGLNVICESFHPEGTLRAGVVKVGAALFLFYPDPGDVGVFASLQALAHEAGHLWLQHELGEAHSHGKAGSSEQECEAELFARLVILERAAATERCHNTPDGLTRYFGEMDKAGG